MGEPVPCDKSQGAGQEVAELLSVVDPAPARGKLDGEIRFQRALPQLEREAGGWRGDPTQVWLSDVMSYQCDTRLYCRFGCLRVNKDALLLKHLAGKNAPFPRKEL